MIPKLFSDKFKARIEELNLTIPALLGFYKTKIIFYPFITSKGFQDIKKVFKQTEEEDWELIEYYGKWIKEDMTLMEKAKVIAQVVNGRMQYMYDSVNFSQAEYWASPIEIHRAKIDDCDGYAVLMCYVLRLFGAKESEVFVAAGNIISGGHAYVLVLDEDTMLYFPLEGSYEFYKTIKEFGKLPHHLNRRYKSVWWITNDKVSYSSLPYFRFIR